MLISTLASSSSAAGDGAVVGATDLVPVMLTEVMVAVTVVLTVVIVAVKTLMFGCEMLTDEASNVTLTSSNAELRADVKEKNESPVPFA